MASITIRNLDPATKKQLRIRAARRGVSMEEEARQNLRDAERQEEPSVDLAHAISALFDVLAECFDDRPRHRRRLRAHGAEQALSSALSDIVAKAMPDIAYHAERARTTGTGPRPPATGCQPGQASASSQTSP